MRNARLKLHSIILNMGSESELSTPNLPCGQPESACRPARLPWWALTGRRGSCSRPPNPAAAQRGGKGAKQAKQLLLTMLLRKGSTGLQVQTRNKERVGIRLQPHAHICARKCVRVGLTPRRLTPQACPLPPSAP